MSLQDPLSHLAAATRHDAAFRAGLVNGTVMMCLKHTTRSRPHACSTSHGAQVRAQRTAFSPTHEFASLRKLQWIFIYTPAVHSRRQPTMAPTNLLCYCAGFIFRTLRSLRSLTLLYPLPVIWFLYRNLIETETHHASFTHNVIPNWAYNKKFKRLAACSLVFTSTWMGLW